MENHKKKQIAIIGAGISGLLACKYAVSKGFHPIVFESRSQLGGAWIKTLKTTKLQTPKPFYQFSDFPWPASLSDDFPNQLQVLDYIQSYANHFDLMKHIKFCTKVVGIEYEGVSEEEVQKWSLWSGNGEPFGRSDGKWNVLVQENQSHKVEVYAVDFVILCIGRFSDIPNIPEFPPGKGPDVFKGEVIHSMEYSDMDNDKADEFVAGKRVVVVGFQKSAMDIAMECNAANGKEKPCTVLVKNSHWNMPDYLPWGIPLSYFYFSRFSELLVHKPGEGFLLYLLATILSPLRWASSKFVESHVRNKHPLKKFGMLPKHSFLEEVSACMTPTVPPRFYEKVQEGSIVLKKAHSFSFCQEGVIVDGETEPVRTDLVILATGFSGDKKLKDIFVSRTFQDSMMGSPRSIVPLYRECIHPRIPQLAVVGFSESISNLFTSEMRCKWVAEMLDGKIRLPGVVAMEKDVEKWDAYMKRYTTERYRRSCIGALHVWYNDQLCKDMGWNPRRKKGFFTDLFEPYGPLDYASP